MTTNADMAAHHAAQSVHFHDLAQRARKQALEAKDRRRWLDKLKFDDQAREYRSTRDYHKGEAKRYAVLT